MSKARLICPKCGAQYEVPADVIPENGRDVECSSCMHTWFQMPPAPLDPPAEPEPAPSAAPSEPPQAETPPPPPQAPKQPPTPAPSPAPAPAAEKPRPDLAPETPRPLDPAVADVLREEAALEKRKREAEALETQPDLGLRAPDQDAQARRAREARERMALIRGDDDQVDTPDPAPRSDALPDVEEISQTLRSDSAPRGSLDGLDRFSSPKPARKSFARGFVLPLALMIALIAIYIAAPRLAEMFPGLTSVLQSYVDMVDGLRRGLNDLIGPKAG